MNTMNKWEWESVCVLAWGYSAFDLADHLADVMPETLVDGRRIWDLSSMELAQLAVNNYPGGACELQCVLEECYS